MAHCLITSSELLVLHMAIADAAGNLASPGGPLFGITESASYAPEPLKFPVRVVTQGPVKAKAGAPIVCNSVLQVGEGGALVPWDGVSVSVARSLAAADGPGEVFDAKVNVNAGLTQ